MTVAGLYADEDHLVECDNCDRKVNYEDSSHVPPDYCGAEGRVCYVCAHNEALWQQEGLTKPAWETKGRYDDDRSR